MIFREGFSKRLQRKCWLVLVVVAFQVVWAPGTVAEEEKPTRYDIVVWNWEEAKVPITVAAWILLACIAKISKSLCTFIKLNILKILLIKNIIWIKILIYKVSSILKLEALYIEM